MVSEHGEMIDLFQTASAVEDLCHRQGWSFCFIGGLALQRWGRPRVTQDVDLTLLTGFGSERPFIDILLRHYSARVQDPVEFALRNRVLLLVTDSGIGIDVALGAIPYEERLVARATPFEFFSGVSLRTCSAEDLVTLKAFADRPRDWDDIEGIVSRQRGLDWDTIESELQPLVENKESPEILDRLRQRRFAAS
jgi:hypothetical protein